MNYCTSCSYMFPRQLEERKRKLVTKMGALWMYSAVSRAAISVCLTKPKKQNCHRDTNRGKEAPAVIFFFLGSYNCTVLWVDCKWLSCKQIWLFSKWISMKVQPGNTLSLKSGYFLFSSSDLQFNLHTKDSDINKDLSISLILYGLLSWPCPVFHNILTPLLPHNFASNVTEVKKEKKMYKLKWFSQGPSGKTQSFLYKRWHSIVSRMMCT